MNKRITSICLDPDIFTTLKDMGINISDQANILFSSWLRHLKEEDMMTKVLNEATVNQFIRMVEDKVKGT